MNTLTITTPHNIELEYELASLGDRILGSVIDYLIIMAYVIIIIAVSSLTNFGNFIGHYIFIIVLLALPVVFYDLGCELLLNGQSPGKKVMNIKVISLSGEQASFSQYLNRWLFRLLDFTVTSYMLGVILVAATEKKQRLGDIVAGTVLVRTRSRTELVDTLYQPENAITYNVVYPEVINLKDADIQLIKEVISTSRRTGNTQLLERAQQKVEQIFNIKSRHSTAIDFLQTVIIDYNHLTSQL